MKLKKILPLLNTRCVDIDCIDCNGWTLYTYDCIEETGIPKALLERKVMRIGQDYNNDIIITLYDKI